MSKQDQRGRRQFLLFAGGVLLSMFGISCASSASSDLLKPLRLQRFWHTAAHQRLEPSQQCDLQEEQGVNICDEHCKLRVTSLSWSPDSKRFVSGSWDSTVRIWDRTTGNQVLPYSGSNIHQDKVTSVAWSFDGARIVSGSRDNTVKIWDATTGRPSQTYRFSGPAVETVAWSYDNRYIIAGGNGSRPEDIKREVKIWDTFTGKNIRTYLDGPPKNIHAVAWSPSNKALVAYGTDSNDVYIQDIYSNKIIFIYKKHEDMINCLAWAPLRLGTPYIASGSGVYYPPYCTNIGEDTNVHVWDASTGRTQYIYAGHSYAVLALTWSPDGQCIASASADKSVHIWKALTGGRIALYTDHSNEVTSVAWSPNGQYLISGDANGIIDLWRLEKSSGKS